MNWWTRQFSEGKGGPGESDTNANKRCFQENFGLFGVAMCVVK